MKHHIGLPDFSKLRDWRTAGIDAVHLADDESIVRDAELRRLWTIEAAARRFADTLGTFGFTIESNQAARDLADTLDQQTEGT